MQPWNRPRPYIAKIMYFPRKPSIHGENSSDLCISCRHRPKRANPNRMFWLIN